MARISRRPLTSELLPGLEADHDNCRARDPAVVRESATKSYGWVQARARVRWVRKATWFDRYPSDADFTPRFRPQGRDAPAVSPDAAR
jgi:hypothetical protein